MILSESLNRVPGLTVLNRQNYAQDLQVSIRGFGARSAFGIRGIRLVVDGIPATTPDGQGQGSAISLTSTERIEVLRGPLAQMYGNSAGGVIQAFTREAPASAEYSAQLYSGSYGLRRTDWQYAERVGAYGLVGDYSTFETMGFRENSQTQRKQFNGTLNFEANEKTHIKAVFNQFDMPLAQDPLGLTAAQIADNPAQAGANAISRNTRKVVLQNQLGGTLVHSIDTEHIVTARVYYGTRSNLQYQTAGATGGWVGLNRHYYGTGLQYSAPARWGGKAVKYLIGYEYDRSKEAREGGAATRGEKTSTTRSEDNSAENSDLFAQTTIALADDVSLLTGLRYSTVRLSSDDHFLSDGNGSGSIGFEASNPVLGLTWQALDNLNLYVNYGQGFESPTLAEVAYSGAGTPAFNSTLMASRSQHYELGAKWIPRAHSRLDFSLFQINSSDELVVASSSGGSSTFKNAPGTTRMGWELSGSTLLSSNVRATLAASAIEARFSSAFTSGTNVVAAGNYIPGIPQSYIFAELLWSASNMEGGKGKANRGSQAAMEVTQAGRLYANDINTAVADGYTTLNLNPAVTQSLAAHLAA